MDIIQIPPRQELLEQWKLICARYNEWLHDEVFSLRWWVLLVLFVLSAYLWWKKADKTRLAEITLYTSIIVIFIIALDELGEELSLWYYPVDLSFLFPPTTAIDITCMPLIYMLIYQRFNKWKGFVVATIVMATVFCFVFEPIFVWGGVYVKLNWKSYYGFPIYIFIAIASKFIVQMIYSRSARKKLL